jgi:catalase
MAILLTINPLFEILQGFFFFFICSSIFFLQGNFDLVGNNFPVFFVRDGMKFPDMVHALKPNPKSHIQENWRIVDFFSHHPESLHMFTFLFDDVGIPLNYRYIYT